MKIRIRRTLPRSFGVAGLLVAALALAEAPAWDPERVAGVSGRLVAALDELLADPGLAAQQATAMQQREHEAAISSIRQLAKLTRDLKKRLDAGYQRDETRPFFDQIELLRGDIAAYARQSWLPESTRSKVEKARDLLESLAGYYDAD
jgi:hypothetical protein